jgi:hypothetical protein
VSDGQHFSLSAKHVDRQNSRTNASEDTQPDSLSILQTHASQAVGEIFISVRKRESITYRPTARSFSTVYCELATMYLQKTRASGRSGIMRRSASAPFAARDTPPHQRGWTGLEPAKRCRSGFTITHSASARVFVSDELVSILAYRPKTPPLVGALRCCARRNSRIECERRVAVDMLLYPLSYTPHGWGCGRTRTSNQPIKSR